MPSKKHLDETVFFHHPCRIMPKRLFASLLLAAALCLRASSPVVASAAPVTPASVAAASPAVFIEAQDSFQSALVAAFIKKNVPAILPSLLLMSHTPFYRWLRIAGASFAVAASIAWNGFSTYRLRSMPS
jgi:hypothetical protein